MEKQKPTQINSVSKYIEAIFDLKENKLPEASPASHWFFRGQSNVKWNIVPNVFRNDGLVTETESIQNALRQRPYDFRECQSNFEILTKLQHYGLGTRLLDVTLNPLVALYFASEPCVEMVYGKDKRAKPCAMDGKIVYKYEYGHKLTELNIRIACALPFIDIKGDFTLNKLCTQLEADRIISADEEMFLLRNECQELIKSIQSDHFVISSHSNERLIRQSGAFIVPTAINIHNNSGKVRESHICKSFGKLDDEFSEHYFIIPQDKKESIREELDFLNINEATLFPELEHQLSYLKKRKAGHGGFTEEYKKFEATLPIPPDQPNESVVEPKPDIDAILRKHVPFRFSQVEIYKIIKEAMKAPDWWRRDTILSGMKRDITRELQNTRSAIESKRIAQEIVLKLVEPDLKK